MSCRAQIVKRKALLLRWCCFSDPPSFGWCCGFLRNFGGVDFTSFLGAVLLYPDPPSLEWCFEVSSFLLLGWCWRFLFHLGWCWGSPPPLILLVRTVFPSSSWVVLLSPPPLLWVVRRFPPPPLGGVDFLPSSRQHCSLFSVTLIHCAHDMTCLESADCLKIHFIWIDEMWIVFTLIEWTKKILMKKNESY